MPFLMNETIKALDKSVLARAMVDGKFSIKQFMNFIKIPLSCIVIIREIVAKRLGIPVPDYTPQQSEPAVTEAAPTSQDPTTGERRTHLACTVIKILLLLPIVDFDNCRL